VYVKNQFTIFLEQKLISINFGDAYVAYEMKETADHTLLCQLSIPPLRERNFGHIG